MLSRKKDEDVVITLVFLDILKVINESIIKVKVGYGGG